MSILQTLSLAKRILLLHSGTTNFALQKTPLIGSNDMNELYFLAASVKEGSVTVDCIIAWIEQRRASHCTTFVSGTEKHFNVPLATYLGHWLPETWVLMSEVLATRAMWLENRYRCGLRSAR